MFLQLFPRCPPQKWGEGDLPKVSLREVRWRFALLKLGRMFVEPFFPYNPSIVGSQKMDPKHSKTFKNSKTGWWCWLPSILFFSEILE